MATAVAMSDEEYALRVQASEMGFASTSTQVPMEAHAVAMGDAQQVTITVQVPNDGKGGDELEVGGCTGCCEGEGRGFSFLLDSFLPPSPPPPF